MTKRILSAIILAIMLITSSFAAYALDDYKELNALGVMPDDIYEKSSDALVSRSELACITAKIMDNSDRAAMDTRFCDVDASNEYSGYIEFLADAGVINGTGGCSFIPDGYVNTDVANKMLLCAIGYGTLAETIGGYPDGYRILARRLSLNKSVVPDTNGNLTTDAMARMLINLLETKLPSVGISIGDTSSELSQSGSSVLGDVLGVSVYEGKITSIDAESGKLTYRADYNAYESNPVMISFGDELILSFEDYSMAAQYDNVPSVIWVSEDKEVIYIEAADNVEVSYKVIDSINGDRNTSSKYSVTNMKQITFLDDEEVYDVASDAELRYNNVLTRTSIGLIGNTARVVTVDDEVVYIESWALTEGGIITDKTSEEITYTRGGKNGLLLTELHLYDNVVVIIDGELGTYGLIKEDSVFDYYLEDNFVVFVVSEKKMVDTFSGISSQGVELGQISYDTKDVYYSRDGLKYAENSDYSSILNLIVDAYVGPDGYIRYIKPSANQELAESKFYGVVCAVEEATFNTDTKIQLWNIGDEVTKEIYEIKKNTVMNDGITLDELITNSSDFDGKGVYVFETNPNLTIRSISRPLKVRGFDSVTSTSSEPLRFLGTDNRIIYHDTVDFVGLYTDIYGDFTADYVAASVIKRKSKPVDFYSLNGDLDVSLAVINGDLAELAASGDAEKAILIKKKNVLTDDDKVMIELTLLRAGGTDKYRVSTKTANSLDLYSIVSYGTASAFSEDEILIREDIAPVSLSGDYRGWETTSEAQGFHFAYVEAISGDKIAFSDGTVYSISSSLDFCAEYKPADRGEPFTSFDLKYLTEGDYVYYFTTKLSSVYVAVNGLVVIR